MDSAVPRFWFDYVDPWSFVTEIRLREAERQTGVETVRAAFELRPPPASPQGVDGPTWLARWVAAEREAHHLGLDLVRTESVPWTRKAHELAVHARSTDRFADLHDALFRAYHLEGRDIGRIDVLVDIGARVGLDRTEIRMVLGVDRHLDDVRSLRDSAEREGVRGVPTLTFEQRRLEGLAAVDAIVALLTGR